MNKSEKYVDVKSLDEYIKLPIGKKTTCKWFWPDYWYIIPFALPINYGINSSNNGNGTWDDFFNLIKKEYPVQYWVRETVLSNLASYLRVKRWRFSDFYRKWVTCTFTPMNDDIAKAIPKREYKDIDTIIVDVLFATVLSFVDNDKCFENLDFTTSEKDRLFAKKLKEIHKYIKIIRPELNKNLEVLLTEASAKTGLLAYKKRYGAYDKLADKIREKDTWYCVWIVENRAKMWA